ncbi:MAG: Gfo/Idh/MocA family oxidoreductase [bacterium]|nr:Gfo/Idh/MocA family oxidoreductase [bacterium]
MPKISVIGAGYWGPNIIRNFYELGCLTAVCDKDEKRLSIIKNKFTGIVTTKDADEAIALADAVVIATHVASHYELTKKALTAGKDVFVEKPFTLKTTDAEELVELAKKKNCIIMVGHILLYQSEVRKLKEYVDTNELGKIYYIYTQRLNLGKVRQTEDVLWSLGPHDISIVLYLLNKTPNKVVAFAGTYLQPGIPDLVFLNLYFADNTIAHIHLSWLDPSKNRTITVVGDKKMATFNDAEANDRIKLYDKGINYESSSKSFSEAFPIRVGTTTIPNVPSKECLKAECEHFISCIQNRTTPITDGINGLNVVKILEAAQKSLELGGAPVSL